MACRQVNMNAAWAASFAAALDREFCRCVRQSFVTALDREFCHCIGQISLLLCWTDNFATVMDKYFATVMDRQFCHCVNNNNNNSYIALYPVKIYKLAALYIKIR